MLEDALVERMMKGFRDVLILHFVSRTPHHGYEINKKFKEHFKIEYPSSIIYPVLRDLEEKGYIESKWSRAGGRKRRVYSITERGKEILRTTRSIVEDRGKETLRCLLGD